MNNDSTFLRICSSVIITDSFSKVKIKYFSLNTRKGQPVGCPLCVFLFIIVIQSQKIELQIFIIIVIQEIP